MYTIRKVKLTPSNKKNIRNLDKRFFPCDCRVRLAKNTVWWLAYDKKGNVVGFAGLHITSPKRAFLTRCAVALEARGHGLQRRFIRVREKEARKRGAQEVWSYVVYDNLPSINNLIREGYRFFRPHPYWRRTYTLQDAYFVKKTLGS